MVGEEPTLHPSESFEYTSVCPLSTSRGTMEGEYNMISLSKGQELFDVNIGKFALDMGIVG